jgi:hypothetical protein
MTLRMASRLLRSSLASIAFVVASRCSYAQTNCPWLNAATAGGFLGGEVQMTATQAPSQPKPAANMYPYESARKDLADVDCAFTRTVDGNVASLKIEVRTIAEPAKNFLAYAAHCQGAKASLRGIGNEAFACISTQATTEQIIGRVRDRAFTITVQRSIATQPIKADSPIHDDTRNIAEQVSGSLF